MTIDLAIRLAIILFVVGLFPAGFITGCQHEKERHDQTKAYYKALGERQEKETKDRIDKDKADKSKVEIAHAKSIKDRQDKFSSLYARYAGMLNDNSHSGIVSGHPSGAGEPVQKIGAVCFNGDGLDLKIRQALSRFATGAVELLQRGEDGLDDRRWWGDFARRTQACPAEN